MSLRPKHKIPERLRKTRDERARLEHKLAQAHRNRYLRRRQIKHSIPEPKNQRTNRQRRGSKGGRPAGFDKTIYRRRNEVSGRSTR
ncbi:hypothetical protein Airi01_053380 [Actinoallomurus iriomotensis]|uniref:Transposase n=1 Tax=Actinoallomurus iriomotensis TaxID=478107 RepID=A0A9W6RJC5_9ACTN|nr:hypothetical protein Airi01_053380 [Actinoallomurus iriomotensis]